MGLIATAVADGSTSERGADTSALDTTYLQDLTTQCEYKAREWDQSSKMRADELTALNGALNVMKDKVAPTRWADLLDDGTVILGANLTNAATGEESTVRDKLTDIMPALVPAAPAPMVDDTALKDAEAERARLQEDLAAAKSRHAPLIACWSLA